MQRTIIFQRSAHAEPSEAHRGSSLSEKGREQAASVLRKLEGRGLGRAQRLLTAQAKRAVETMEYEGRRMMHVLPQLDYGLSGPDGFMFHKLFEKIFRKHRAIVQPYRVIAENDTLKIYERWASLAKQACLVEIGPEDTVVRICCHENFVSALALAFIPEAYAELRDRVLDRHLDEACCIVLTLNNDLPTKLDFLEP